MSRVVRPSFARWRARLDGARGRHRRRRSRQRVRLHPGTRPAQRRSGDAHRAQRLQYDGAPMKLMDISRGIRSPRCSMPPSASRPRSPRTRGPSVRRRPGPDGLLRYKWEGADPNHWNNVALRVALRQRRSLIWFHGIEPAVFMPIPPVFLMAEEAELQQFVVAIDLEQLDQRSLYAGLPMEQRRR